MAFAGGDGVLFGTVIDSATKRPISDAVVTATSPSLQGEQIGVSDETGLYRVSQLPPGIYALRFEKEGYRPFTRGAIALRVDTTLRFNVELLPEVLTQETVVVAARVPTVDVGSTQLSTSVGPDLIQRLPLAPPGGKNGAVRSFESLAELTPTGQADRFGFSLNGSTSNENNFVIDGLSVNDPAYAALGSPLSLEFIREVNVISGGYMPEFGRSTGGVFDVVTKSGSNEFHGSIFGYYSPGSLDGSARQISREASAISTTTRSFNIGSLGGEVGGPISKDKLWFYAGFSPAYSRFQLERNLNMINFDAGGIPIRDSAGLTTTSRIPGTQKFYFADQRSYQYIGKLTYLVNRDHSLTFSLYGTPTSSGGNNALGFDPNTGAVETNLLDGQIGAIGHQYIFNSANAALKYSSSWLDKRLLFDATAGWHHQSTAVRGMDGSQVGSSTGLASISDVWWGSGPYDLRRFEPVPNNPDGTNPCDSTSPSTLRCPVASYNTGGPRGPYWPLGVPISEGGLDRVQGRFVGTYFASGLGHHIVKAGLDLERLTYHKDKGVAGTVQFADLFGDGNLYDYREFGYLQGPDRPVIQSVVSGTTHSNLAGLFLQDSWSILDQVTVNVGLRYDVQTMQGNDGRTAIALKNEWSPRIGAVYDFTGEGRSKLFASYAKYYEAVPLNMIDRSFPGDRFLFSGRPLAVCNPSDPVQQRGSCRDPNNLVALSVPNDPNQKWGGFNQDTIPVDPNIKAQENDEVVAGAEYEVIRDGRAGLSYTHRELVNVIEDMSRDEGFTYFIGNPGTGIASDFPKGQRKYDAISFYFAKRFSELWLAQASYTWSRLRGNYSGMFRPENGQLEPNLTSDFDLKSLMVNRTGNLPADHAHAFKFFGAKEFELTGGTHLTLGMSYVARSGSPLNYLGAHYLYGPSEAFILPRGAAGRLPWMHSIDARLGLGYRMAGGYVLSLGADVFNLFNFQAVAAADQNYTFATVRPIENGAASDLSTLTDPTGTPIPAAARNPNFLRPIAYQPPRSIRFSARVSF